MMVPVSEIRGWDGEEQVHAEGLGFGSEDVKPHLKHLRIDIRLIYESGAKK